MWMKMMKMMMMMMLSAAPLGASGSEEEAPPGAPPQRLQALHCPPCERVHCSTRRALKLQCKGGVTTGVCGCCPVCARTEGESCGGTWDYLGKCDQGLVCLYPDPGPAERAERRGTCQPVIESVDEETCRPECSREFCQANPSEICSARSASVEKKSCQGSCQHTSCSSCLLLRAPPCPQTCGPGDSACLHHFGKCVHGHLKAAHGQICHSELQNQHQGHFVCLLPACVNITPP